jgi:hypothetical protein
MLSRLSSNTFSETDKETPKKDNSKKNDNNVRGSISLEDIYDIKNDFANDDMTFSQNDAATIPSLRESLINTVEQNKLNNSSNNGNNNGNNGSLQEKYDSEDEDNTQRYGVIEQYPAFVPREWDWFSDAKLLEELENSILLTAYNNSTVQVEDDSKRDVEESSDSGNEAIEEVYLRA